MRKYLSKYILLPVTLLLLVGCLKRPTNDCDKLSEKAKLLEKSYSENMLYRDSLFLNITVYSFIDSLYTSNFDGYFRRLKLNSPDEIKVNVNYIFYSADFSKFVSTVTVGIPTYAMDSETKRTDYYDQYELLYNGYFIYGFKDNKSNIWRIYPSQLLGNHEYFSSKQEVTCNQLQVLFEDIKDIQMGYWSPKDDDYKRPVVGYTIDDNRFWESIIWQKGLMVEGLYNFQILGSPKPKRFNKNIIHELSISYPDSILEMFNEH